MFCFFDPPSSLNSNFQILNVLTDHPVLSSAHLYNHRQSSLGRDDMLNCGCGVVHPRLPSLLSVLSLLTMVGLNNNTSFGSGGGSS